MSAPRGQRGRAGSDTSWLDAVAGEAAEAAGVPADLLGEYLTLLAGAATAGRRAQPRELAAVRRLGGQAARQGVDGGRVVDLYLSAAWRLWRELPATVQTRDRNAVRAAADAVLRLVDDAVAALVEGYQAERRQLIRREEALRRQVIDDLLRGDADLSRLVQRAEPFGLDLTVTHRIALAAPGDPGVDVDAAAAQVEHAVVDRFGDRDVLVAGKDGNVVALVPHPGPPVRGGRAQELGAALHAALGRVRGGQPWRVAAGRAYQGAYGIARSYEEAREALQLAERLQLDTPVVDSGELLIYRVLGRDQAAIIDLVGAVLGPLAGARGGAEPLLDTLRCYFDSGQVATETARRLHLSVRAVTYRLARIRALTGHDPTDPAQRFTLHAAVLGARLLGWPQHELPAGD